MTITTNERGQQNIFAKEPPMIMTEVTETHNERAERLNGRTGNAWSYCCYWCLSHHWSADSWNPLMYIDFPGGFYSGPTFMFTFLYW